MRTRIDNLLKSKNLIINCSIKKVWRMFSQIENEDIPKSILDEESDGITFIEIDNNQVIIFYPNTLFSTLDYNIINKDEMPTSPDLRDVSNNIYWKKRIHKRIIDLNGVIGGNNMIHGLKIELEDNRNIQLLYFSETEYSFDTLVIR